MGCRPCYLVFKNVLFFMYCTEQNTKEIIEAFLNGMALQHI